MTLYTICGQSPICSCKTEEEAKELLKYLNDFYYIENQEFDDTVGKFSVIRLGGFIQNEPIWKEPEILSTFKTITHTYQTETTCKLDSLQRLYLVVNVFVEKPQDTLSTEDFNNAKETWKTIKKQIQEYVLNKMPKETLEDWFIIHSKIEELINFIEGKYNK